MSSAEAPKTTPLTIPARILPGWMERECAMNMLTQQCVPSLSEEDAERLWAEYRERVANLPGRRPNWERLPLAPEDKAHIDRYMSLLRRVSGDRHEVAEIVKVDLRQLTAVQQIVITERSVDYAGMSISEAVWRDEFLPVNVRPPQIGCRCIIGQPHHDHPLHSTILFDLPDAEFAFLPHGNGLFGVSQLSRHVITYRYGDSLILKNGYHRSLARILHAAETSTAPTALVALEKSCVDAAPAAEDLPGFNPGITPALLSDYTKDGLYLNVAVRRKRYQIEVKARWMAVDEQ